MIPPIPAIPQQTVQNQNAPIADLSYRNYDGPLNSRAIRWWTIALAMFKLHTKPLSFKVIGALAMLPYLFVIVVLWLQGQLSTAGGGRPSFLVMTGLVDTTPGQKFALQFYNALGYQLLYLVILTLIAGAGCIASDNKNNALLIYLSKPITKNDYLLGKWMGLFLSIFTVAFGPAALLYFYCMVSFYSDGFFKDEPRLFLHMLTATGVTAAVFSSIMVGLSAWSKSPRITGAIVAAIYFAGQVVSFTLWRITSGGDANKDVILAHSSIGGAISGLSQVLYGVTVHTLRGRMKTGFHEVDYAPPSAFAMWGILIGLAVIGIAAARIKIRAVEVIS